ncbi:MAG TPA: hypothetical protein VLV49_15540, partial [Terriglobales bacterium]|nr:hypothetical protein [Terriglobales bacterium]
PVFIPQHPTQPQRVTTEALLTEQIDRLEVIEEVMYTECIVDDPVTREADIAVLRMKHLLKLRKGFGIVTVFLLGLLVASVALHFPYEPAAALFACTMGTFLVFVMKVRDGRP